IQGIPGQHQDTATQRNDDVGAQAGPAAVDLPVQPKQAGQQPGRAQRRQHFGKRRRSHVSALPIIGQDVAMTATWGKDRATSCSPTSSENRVEHPPRGSPNSLDQTNLGLVLCASNGRYRTRTCDPLGVRDVVEGSPQSTLDLIWLDLTSTRKRLQGHAYRVM